jgi:enoyl-CoA hydratase
MPKWLQSTDNIIFEVRDRTATITLNRPAKRNALSVSLLQELHGALLEADDRTDVSSIVIAGAGQDFCVGYDLDGAYARAQSEQQEGFAYRKRSASIEDDAWGLERTQSYLSIIFDIHKPVVAKVHGNCLAGGTDLALWCDMVIAAENAKIGFPATRANGSPPAHMWVYHCGPQWAKRILMTGDCVNGIDAAKLGLVLDAVPPEELDQSVAELTRRLNMIDTDLLAAQKRIVNLALELAGSRTIGRLAAEMDAKAHLSTGPKKAAFDRDQKEAGLKAAFKNRDEGFGDGFVRVRR